MDAETSSVDSGARRLTATAVLGFVATSAIVLGALLGGSAYETHLPGAWFFGMPGGLFGSIGSSAVHPPIYAVIAVYGGMILFVRVWIGLLRHLSSHQGVPVTQRRLRGRHLGRAAPAGPPAVQPRRLQLRRTG